MNMPQQRLFILAGMPRTATTFLYQRFQEHPAIFCPYRKETNFFSVNYHKGPAWYRKLYDDMADGQIGADVSPAYFLDELAIDRIHAFEPRTPVILGVRPASEWALSWYTQVLSNHLGAKPSFEEFVTGYTLRISGGDIWQDFRNGFVRRMIDRYRDDFGDNILLYHYRALREDPLALINGIESFLGVPQQFSEDNLTNEIVNAGTRRNIGFIAYLLSQEKFVDFVGRLVPRQLVQAARNAYVSLGTTKGMAERPSFTEEEIAFTKQIFAEDDRWIETLFAESSIQLGSSGSSAT
ncbi:MAG: sulfotransferase domain-containing protein [Gammaproteobacteria bacterium]|nr:sulfotransferase domain-containing protein [Gammaproteobacteria bacterium]